MLKRAQLWGVGLLLALAALSGLFIYRALRPRIIARAVAPDGTEMCLVQRLSDGPWFNTGFYYRRPGQPWKWMYYDHEGKYWGGSRVTLDTNAAVATFYRGSTPAITFHWETEAYLLHRRNSYSSNGSAMPEGWEPSTK